MRWCLVMFCVFVVVYGQTARIPIIKSRQAQLTPTNLPPAAVNLHNSFSEGIGNFSLEILDQVAKGLPNDNVIMSPFTVWTLLAVVSEGANGITRTEIRQAARLSGKKVDVRTNFQSIGRWLKVNTSTVELVNYNALYTDKRNPVELDYQQTIRSYYETDVVTVNFSDKTVAKRINDDISHFTHGRIDNIVDPSYFDEPESFLVSALYFKGQWSAPFNVSSTEKRPFYDSDGRQIGEVNMMYNRFTYPFANIKEIQARVIEIPYGNENRLSMLIMLPDRSLTPEAMFLKFQQSNTPLDKVFQELTISKEEYSDDEVDCLIPRFKIESSVVLNTALRSLGVKKIFDPLRADLSHMFRNQTYVTKVVHKAEIEVVEEGTTASAVTAAEFANRIGVVRFEANRPFAYMIVEKVTNTITFGGVYRLPSLY